MSIDVGRFVGVPAIARAQSSWPRIARGALDVVPFLTECVAIVTLCFGAGLAQPGLAAVAGMSCLTLAGTYRRRLTLAVLDVTPRIAAASVAAAAAVSLSGGALQIGTFAAVAGSLFAATVAGRTVGYGIQRRLRRTDLLSRRTAVIGTGPVIPLLLQSIAAEPACGLRSVSVPGSPGEGLGEVLRSHRVEAAIVAVPLTEDGGISDIVTALEDLDCEVFLVPQSWQLFPVTGSMDRIGAIPLLRLAGLRPRGALWQFKLGLDRCLAGAALVVLAPLLAVLAAAVYFSDTSAPVLFSQRRVGLDGREFDLLKFRSLRPASDQESQTTWTISGDPRLSPFGRLLRASSLDELPQLWNVLRGDMTLVGPRPERPHFVETFSSSVPGYAARHRVPVGLTGWAAVNGLRGDTSIADRARYDNFYIANWSLWFDLTIVLRTVAAVVANFRQQHSAGPEVLKEAPCPSP